MIAKRLLKTKLFFFPVLLISVLLIAASANNKSATELVILFTHDMHSNLDSYLMPQGAEGTIETGGYARLSTAINNERRGKEDRVLVIDGGDFSMGTFFHAIRSTHSPELITMGLMGYDATTFGNHEFEFGPRPLAQALLVAKSKSQGKFLPIIASNTVIDSKLPELTDFSKAYNEYPVTPYMIIQRSGLKVGLFGLMGKDAAIYAPEGKPVTFSDPISAARKTVDILRSKEKVDMVICLSHSGTWKDKTISEDEILAKEVPGIDVIISGHTHTTLDPYIQVGNTYVVSSGCYSRFLGRLTVIKNPNGTFRVLDYKLLPITSEIPEDPQIASLVKSFEKDINKEYLSAFNYHYGEMIARAPFSMPDPDWDKCYGCEECMISGLGDLVTDAFIYAVKKQEGKNYRDISLAFEGFGQIRVPIARGPITVNDTFRLLALGLGVDGKAGAGLATFWLTGDEIRKIFEIEATFASAKYDMHLQISGMRFSYDPKAEPLSRVKTVEVKTQDGKFVPLEDNRLYRACTDWKLLAMRDNLTQLSGGKIVFIPKDESGKPIADLTTTRVFLNTDKSLELKAWLAVVIYLQSFPVGDSNLPEVPERYRKAQVSVTVVSE
ncbi:MAG: 5'-nucleotidase C-terminal domain-containing protein [Candidatus Omnitrophota bacterium]|nr:5'-nucleotidase C-terminal domain-containing protein [Candidatus Omnitrophota bacterium]